MEVGPFQGLGVGEQAARLLRHRKCLAVETGTGWGEVFLKQSLLPRLAALRDLRRRPYRRVAEI